MNIVFFGTSIFAVPSLKAVVGSRHKILVVVTQPDRKKGRGLHLTPSPVKEIATALGIPVYQPQDVSAEASIKELKTLNADLFVVVAFGQLFEKEVLAVPKKFAINLHASLLPKYRGAAPINWAIIKGEKKTGITIFRLEEKMDAGDIILTKEIDIADEDNTVTLSEKLSNLGANALLESLDLIENGKAFFNKQDERLASFAPKLKKSDGLIDWKLPAIELHNRVRGLLPWPAAFTFFNGRMVKVLETKIAEDAIKSGTPGQITALKEDFGICVRTGKGLLVIRRLQIEGSRPMRFDEFLRGHKLEIGDTLV